MNRDRDFDSDHMNNGLGWFIALLLAALLIAAIAALIVYAVNRGKSVNHDVASSHADEGKARRVLDERLARGEIAREEYRQRRRALET